MTGTREPQQEGRIQAMLRDAGLESSTELRGSLEELSALVPDRAPAPSAELAALLAHDAHQAAAPGTTDATMTAGMPETGPGEAALPAGVTSLAERRGRKRRLAVASGAVLAAMTFGAGAVAASSEDFRQNVSHSVGSIFQPSDATPDPAPRPARPSPSDLPAPPAPSKAPAGATAPPVAGAVAGEPGSAPALRPNPGTAAAPPAVGRDGVLPTPPHRPVTPAVPGLPAPVLPGPAEDRSGGKDPLPLPALPGVLPTHPGQR